MAGRWRSAASPPASTAMPPARVSMRRAIPADCRFVATAIPCSLPPPARGSAAPHRPATPASRPPLLCLGLPAGEPLTVSGVGQVRVDDAHRHFLDRSVAQPIDDPCVQTAPWVATEVITKPLSCGRRNTVRTAGSFSFPGSRSRSASVAIGPPAQISSMISYPKSPRPVVFSVIDLLSHAMLQFVADVAAAFKCRAQCAAVAGHGVTEASANMPGAVVPESIAGGRCGTEHLCANPPAPRFRATPGAACVPVSVWRAGTRRLPPPHSRGIHPGVRQMKDLLGGHGPTRGELDFIGAPFAPTEPG